MFTGTLAANGHQGFLPAVPANLDASFFRLILEKYFQIDFETITKRNFGMDSFPCGAAIHH